MNLVDGADVLVPSDPKLLLIDGVIEVYRLVNGSLSKKSWNFKSGDCPDLNCVPNYPKY